MGLGISLRDCVIYFMENCGFDLRGHCSYSPHSNVCCGSRLGGSERTASSHDGKNRKWSRSFPRGRALCRRPRVRDPCTGRQESPTPSCFYSTPLWFKFVRVKYLWLSDQTWGFGRPGSCRRQQDANYDSKSVKRAKMALLARLPNGAWSQLLSGCAPLPSQLRARPQILTAWCHQKLIFSPN